MGGRRIVDVHFAKVITALSLGNKVQELSRRHLRHRIFVTCTCTKFNVPSSSSDEHKDFVNAGGLLSPKVYGQFLLSFLSYFFYRCDCIHGIQEDVSVSNFITSSTFTPLNRLDRQFDPTIASISAEGRFVNVSGQSPDILRVYKRTI